METKSIIEKELKKIDLTKPKQQIITKIYNNLKIKKSIIKQVVDEYLKRETCSICNDVKLNDKNKSIFNCCNNYMCNICYNNNKLLNDNRKCPFCNKIIIDTTNNDDEQYLNYKCILKDLNTELNILVSQIHKLETKKETIKRIHNFSNYNNKNIFFNSKDDEEYISYISALDQEYLCSLDKQIEEIGEKTKPLKKEIDNINIKLGYLNVSNGIKHRDNDVKTRNNYEFSYDMGMDITPLIFPGLEIITNLFPDFDTNIIRNSFQL